MISTSDQNYRRLAAVVFLDMVGYSALMQENESRAQAALDVLWGIARPLVAQHGGTEVRLFGDGMLLTFDGTWAAARCILQVFEGLARHNLALTTDKPVSARAGIHLGDIANREGEIFGDGVNIASRLVALAPPGGLALSPHVRDQLINTLDHPLKSLGLKSLKNIKTPMEVFCLPGPECSADDLSAAAMGGNTPARLWRFGVATFDERALELSVAGHAIALERNCIEILLVLLRHAGEVVTSEELCEAAHGISELELEHCIGQLRQALRDERQEQIKSQSGFGYRLATLVSVESAPSQTLTQFDYKPGDHPPMRPLWSLEKLLGAGGHGEVWLARHDKTHEQRVYKFALDASKLSSLKREITLSRVLHSTARSAHFIRVLDWNLELSPYFIECEYGGSSDLLGWAQSQGGINQVPMAERLELAIQIAEALAAAHSVGVLHKDLKPNNILIQHVGNESPRIKLADFGSGEVLDPQHMVDAGVTRMGFTQEVLVDTENSAGTPIYFAPELFSGQPATVQADVYALGVMLYQLIVGNFRKPLATGWEADIDDALLREDIAQATHGDPEQRLADAAGFANRLRNLEARREQRRADMAAAEQAQRQLREAQQIKQRLHLMKTRRRWVITVMLALTVGLGMAVYAQQAAVAAREEATMAAAQSQAIADFLSKDLFTVVGGTPLAELNVMELLQIAAEKLNQREQQLPHVSAKLHAALGQAFWNMERIDLAQAELEPALSNFERAGDIDSADALQVAATLLALQTDFSSLKTQLPRYQRIFASGRRKLGLEHPSVVALAQQIAFASFNAGQWRNAAQLYAELIAAQPELSASQTTGFGTLQTYYANVLLQLGDFLQAENLLREAAKAPNARPMDHAAAEYFLTLSLIEQEKFAEAESALSRSEEIIKKWAAKQSSMARLSLRLMRGRLRLRQGQARTAVEILEPVAQEIAAFEGAQGVDLSGEPRFRLALAYQASGAMDLAERELRRAITIYAKPVGGAHPMIQAMHIELANILIEVGQHDAASAALSELDQQVLKALGPQHPFQARFWQVRAALAEHDGQADKARQYLERATEILENVYGSKHSFTQTVRTQLVELASS